MRIAVGGIMHESNTFVATPTPLSAFGVVTGAGIAEGWRGAHHELTGYLEGLEEAGAEIYPTLTAGATPSGPVAADALASMVDELLARLKSAPKLDGLLLALHGAMVAEGAPDGDGEVLRRVRAVVGPDFPIVTTLDFHANISEQMAAATTALLVYRTNPHVDQRQTGRRAASLMLRLVKEKRRPTTVRSQPPMVWNILHQNTSREPLRAILAETARLAESDGVLSADLAIGYPYADVHEVGPAAVVVAEDLERARREAARLTELVWAARDRLAIDLPDPAEAVRRAIRSATPPVVLVEMGDNIGGGSPGDGTHILVELVRQTAPGFVVAVWDPDAVARCAEAGVGGEVTLAVGGHTDSLHGAPVTMTGRVERLHEGRFIETEPRHGGQRDWNQGATAVLALPNDSRVILNSRRTPPFSLGQLRSVGIEPETAKIMVVKAAVAFRAAYEPVAGEIIEVDTAGVTAVSPHHFTYQRARRPLWPLDP